MTETLITEGYMVPIDVAATLMGHGYIVEGMEDRLNGFLVIDDIVEDYENIYE
jgi:hypothetical protein